MRSYAELAAGAAEEMRAAAAGVDAGEFDTMLEELAVARRVVLHGVGREGLMMRALAMRLHHMGLDAHVAGDMTVPPVGPGDLLFVSAGPGDLATVAALVAVAQKAGARTLCVTAQPTGPVPSACNAVLTIPAQTMANDRGDRASSVLPMGSLFEGAQFLVFELCILGLRERLAISPEAMRARHTNLE